MKRTIAVVTGSRAEYGLLRWLMRDISKDPRLQLQVVVTGMHLAPEFGTTVQEITSDGFSVNESVEMLLSSDSRVGMAKSLGLGVISMADAFRRLNPDVVVVLGDRFEILAAAQSASLMGLPVAHISGGEVTEGAVDDWIRHSITKASWWHFVAAEPYRRRVIQLGETPDRVINVGDPALDAIRRLTFMSREELEGEIGIALSSPLILVTYHPATLGSTSASHAFNEILSALDQICPGTILLTKSNADAGGRQLAQIADTWAAKSPRNRRCITSLGQRRYLSVMRLCDAVVGNSSSGIVEAPALKVATVNVGPRQNGRLRASSIIDCQEERESVAAGIERAMSDTFRASLADTKSLYGDCSACETIREIIATALLPRTLMKRFHDVGA